MGVPAGMKVFSCFPRYDEYPTEIPVWRVTPDSGGTFHRFFDTSPISPSGRFLAVTRFPAEDRMPLPGEEAEILLIDLVEGSSRVVAGSRGWDTQLGAQVQWGRDDSELFFNDMDVHCWRPFGVRMNPLTGEKFFLDGTVYMVSPDGRQAISPCLLRTGRTQAGYGVLAPPDAVPRNAGASETDGIYLTDTQSGVCRLLVSLREIVGATSDDVPAASGDFYAFHVKWNPRGDRIMLVLRRVPRDGTKIQPSLVTMSASGGDIRVAIPSSEWGVKGGHHPNWHPDGDHVIMNLNLHGDGMRFVQARADGSEYGAMSEQILGSGHPSLHPDRRHMLTDAYQHESFTFADGTTPIRWCDLVAGQVREVVRICTRPAFPGPKQERRIDPHPAWDRSFRFFTFNGWYQGRRHVFVADASTLLLQ